MKKSLTLLAGLTLALTACTSTPPVDREWVGGAFGGNVTYTVNKITDDKYMLDASSSRVVTTQQLIDAAKIKAQMLCQPETADYRYEMIVSKFKTSKKLAGVVNCR